MSVSADSLALLDSFRARLYDCLQRRNDALYDLCDAILTAGTVPSPPHLSLTPVHRRGWGSLYAALSKGNVAEEAMRELLAAHWVRSPHSTP